MTLQTAPSSTAMAGRTAFVTGAARGIGRAIAESFIAAGGRVAIADTRPEVAETARELGGPEHCLGLSLDVRDIAAFSVAFGQAVGHFGAIDTMVNNAARTVQCSIWDISPADWDDVLATNLRSVFFGCRIAGEHMRERGFGRIINLASIAGQIVSPVAGAHYASSKAAVLMITRMWAAELAPKGITVNAIAPGAVDGPIMEIVPPDRKLFLAQQTPVGRLGAMEEVGQTAVFLASEASGYITGATIDINGGRNMRA